MIFLMLTSDKGLFVNKVYMLNAVILCLRFVGRVDDEAVHISYSYCQK